MFSFSNTFSTFKSALARLTSFFGLPLWILLLSFAAAFFAAAIFLTLCICFIRYRIHRKPYKFQSSLPKSIPSQQFRRRRDSSSFSLDNRLLLGNNSDNIVSGLIPMNSEVSSQVEVDVEEDGDRRDLESSGRFSRGIKKSRFSVEVIEEATNGFAEENLIGIGDHGIAYFGLLTDSNSRVVVKRLASDSCHIEDFTLQMEAVAHVKHKKLVKLIGYCNEGAYRMLVSEYIDNGNLHQWLHEFPGQVSPLTWDLRLKIIKGVAKGLVYLHEDVEPKILHGSLKSSNILLDRQWNPKISDFGIAKLFTADLNMTETLGNVFPDCYSTGISTESNDIYCFGILIMEIVSGRTPLNHNQPQAYIVDWFKSIIANGNIDYLVDSKLPEMPPSKELKQLILVSLRCVDPSLNPKLNMGDVMRMLEQPDLLLSDEHQIVREAYEHNHSPVQRQNASEFGDSRPERNRRLSSSNQYQNMAQK
ncbi:putative serine/threonine-protein kinase [Senna tora]|uniref:non-specific serine/threonine protein kinase n=1 Tax=Senna tora TaxID=362788 RepID=A0A834SYL7_9FABA|nr:putative serine/threonine-protein kinase [Senna tora]